MKTTRRNCLRCEKSFPSEGAHNRLCKHCNQINLKWAHIEGIMNFAVLLKPNQHTEHSSNTLLQPIYRKK